MAVPIQVADTVIRKAVAADAPEITNVHLSAWREAYRDLLPQSYLDQLPLAFRNRMAWWSQTLAEPGQISAFVAESASGIVGFSFFGPARESGMENYGELGAIYLFEKFKGQGVGAMLLKVGMQEFLDRKLSKAYCWVLENNPTIGFYEKSGAVFKGLEKGAEIGGQKVKELVYAWESLEPFRP